ncbi:MAG: ABC-F family ATP-binding cassette domain-containing protein [Tannerella sp.]|jgi:ATP-binding cassette subfamily F protein 3|nr:ABC-F family ATP-binding cassette domain-containing protein [Tannerella sp.]
MITVEGLTVEYGGFTLFEAVSFFVNRKDRIALVGRNGAGKSTLLKILAGLQTPARGAVHISGETTIGYLPQQMELSGERTVRAEAEQAFGAIRRLENEINRLNEQLAMRTDYDSEAYHALIDRATSLSEQFQWMGGMNCQSELERTLTGLGFMREDLARSTSEFSGGWRMRIELAKLLLARPDVLLLDEPTNHLDIESIRWLETFIATRANAVILVSHDRAFINNTTHRTLEIECGKIYDYKVKYAQYTELRRERREQQLRAAENRQKKIADTEEFIDRFRYKASKAVQVQSRIRQLEKMERIEVDDIDTSQLKLKFPPAPHSGAYPVTAEGLAKRYGEQPVFSGVNFTVHRGDKVAFVGKNGAGKSTLVKCIMGEIDYEGQLTLGYQVKIGYFAQNQAELLDESQTVFETVDRVAQGDIRTRLRDILGAFLFGGEMSERKVAVLSGGERSRLAMIRLLLEPANLLILDEPTNHLDMRSKDVLKNALREFDGTLMVVSHDREFLDGLVDKVYEFGHRQIREHLGGIYEFLERKKIESLQELELPLSASLPRMSPECAGVSVSRLSYEEQKEKSRMLRRLEKAVTASEQEIARLEKEIRDLETCLSAPEGAPDVALYDAHAQLKQELSAAMDRWTELTLTWENAQLIENGL